MKEYYKDWLLVLSIALGSFGIGYLLQPKIEKLIHKPAVKQADTVNFEYLQKLCDKHRIKFSHIIIAQAKLESNLNSTVYKRTNNPFGLRIAAQRYCFATNNYDFGNYAIFANLEDAVRDMKSWQIQNAMFITKDEDYLKLLADIYAEDPDYSVKLLDLIK
jgi:flagellum-specific peptidoglycan hydrolase FlgJ